MLTNFTQHKLGLYSATCDLNLEELRNSVNYFQGIISNHFKDNLPSSKTISKSYDHSTYIVTSRYNFCLYPLPEVHELYKTIIEMFYKCYENQHNDKPNNFFMQSWTNLYHKGEFIDWHRHWVPKHNAWHGFYCLNVEPNSYTEYKWTDDIRNKVKKGGVRIESKNNLIVLGESNGDLHKSSIWELDEPRITIAFDFVPEKVLYKHLKSFNQNLGERYINHWIPVL